MACQADYHKIRLKQRDFERRIRELEKDVALDVPPDPEPQRPVGWRDAIVKCSTPKYFRHLEPGDWFLHGGEIFRKEARTDGGGIRRWAWPYLGSDSKTFGTGEVVLAFDGVMFGELEPGDSFDVEGVRWLKLEPCGWYNAASEHGKVLHWSETALVYPATAQRAG